MTLIIRRNCSIKRNSDTNPSFAVKVEAILDTLKKDIDQVFKESKEWDWINIRTEVYK